MPQKNKLNTEISFGGVKDIEILMFTKHLAISIESGLTLIEGLEIIEDQAKGKMKKVVGEMLELVRTGESFHNALEAQSKYFSPIFINMVRAGEISGSLEEKLKRLAVQLQKSQALKKKIRSAMIYPMFVFVAVFGLGLSVAIFVLPKILPLFRTLDVELPATTRGLLFIADVFEKHGSIILAAMVFGSIFLGWLLKRDFIKPLTHRIYLKIPVVKTIIININLEAFTHTFGTLLESGLPIDQSLKIMAQATENRVYRKAIKALIPEIEAGQTIAGAAAKQEKLFPLIVTKMLGVGEKTGNMDNTLKYLAEFYEEAVDEATKNLSTMLEPILLITIGVLVGTVAISILGPIYQITGNLR